MLNATRLNQLVLAATRLDEHATVIGRYRSLYQEAPRTGKPTPQARLAPSLHFQLSMIPANGSSLPILSTAPPTPQISISGPISGHDESCSSVSRRRL
jgi:hypothetical protein